jgi:acetoin utilization protein AcuB
MIAADLMTPDPVTVQPNDDVSTAFSLLQESNFRHLPVVNENDELVGMVSDRDLRALLIPHFHPREMLEHIITRARAPVSTLMSGNVICVDMEDDVSLVAEQIVEHKVGAIPVVDADGKLVGIVSYLDLIRHYASTEPS